MKLRWWVIIILLSVSVYYAWQDYPINPGPGVLAPNDPQQTTISLMSIAEKDGYSIIPLASFNIKARVLHTKHYRFDQESSLSSVDFALGWGKMSDGEILKYFKFSQSDRFYFWSTSYFPIPRNEVESHSANMHIIASNAEIEKQLKKIKPGHIICIQGYLVEVHGSEGWLWKSSLSRTDTGKGACEVVWVKSLKVEEKR